MIWDGQAAAARHAQDATAGATYLCIYVDVHIYIDIYIYIYVYIFIYIIYIHTCKCVIYIYIKQPLLAMRGLTFLTVSRNPFTPLPLNLQVVGAKGQP